MRATIVAVTMAALLTATACGPLGGPPGPGSAGGTATDPAVAPAFTKLRDRAARFERECRASGAGAGAREPGGSGPCDLRDEYADLLARWQAGQARCDAGDAAACRTLVEAAARVPAMDP